MLLPLICAALRLTVDYVIVYIADMAARFGNMDADEFTLQQQNVKTKAATKYAVKVLSDFMLEKSYDEKIGTWILHFHFTRLLRECQNQQWRLLF
jgi:hypothetical protein